MARSELEAALRDNPDDEQTWAVLGDWLTSQGDSHGQLIALEQRRVASDRPFDQAVLQHQATELFQREHRRWLGPLADAGLEIVWYRGFAIEVTIARHHPSTLSKLLELPIAALLRKLTFVAPRSLDSLVERLAGRPITTLELRLTHETSLAPLAELTHLEQLSVDGGHDDGLAALAELPRLRKLSLQRCRGRLHAFAHGFAALRELEIAAHVDAHELGLASLEPLRSLAELSELSLRDAGWSELGPLANLYGLTQLDLRSTDITNLTPLAQLFALTNLRMSGCTQLADLDPLAQLQALRRLEFAYTRVRRISALAKLRALEFVELSGTPVHDLSPLFELPQLRRVALAACEVDDLQPLVRRGVALIGVRPPEPSWRELAERTLAGLRDEQ